VQAIDIRPENIVIALEPECASLYCRNIDTVNFIGGNSSDIFKAGSKYMIVDAGGEILLLV
jgi:hypothetical protein